jgi:PAS domain S-box-containing protein
MKYLKRFSKSNKWANSFRDFMPIAVLVILIGVVVFKLIEIYDLQYGVQIGFFIIGFIIITIFIYVYTTRIIGRSIDSSEELLRNAEVESLNTQKKFRTIFDNSEIGIALLDKEKRPIMVNESFQRILGYTEDELSGMKLTGLTHPDDAEKDLEFDSYLTNTKINKYNVEKRFFNKSGGIFWGNVYVTIERDNSGNPDVVIMMLVDITERKLSENKLKEYSDRLENMVEERTLELFEAQEQLVRKERLAVIGEMAGGIAHELRNPLTSIANAAYYLKMVLSDEDENIIKVIDILSREVTSSEKIISNLLDFTRIQTASQEKCEVKGLIREVIGRIEIAPEIRVMEIIPEDTPAIFVDCDQIKQVLLNLVTNAVQAMPEGGDLEINAVPNGNRVFISIKDTGVGIKKKNIKRIFEPLFSTKSKGIGLGLALSQKITEANGGAISVESKEGEGSTFTVALPKN